jgi:hypothetical protein
MPHRDTVAGEATARSATSKIMFMDALMEMISPANMHKRFHTFLELKIFVAELRDK